MTKSQKQEKTLYLYKYYPALNKRKKLYAKRIFTHNEIYFSCPLDFNDPFDCKAYKLTVVDEEEKPYIKTVKSKMDSSLRDVIILFCLSETKDNILMWSHYSTDHRGFCLEFEVTEGGYFEKAEKAIYTVKNEYQEINLYENNEENLKSMLLVKSKDWEYEKERRIFLCELKAGNYPFPEELLTGVIFGCQMPDEDKQQIKKWVEEGKCSPKFYKAVKKKNEFGLNILPD